VWRKWDARLQVRLLVSIITAEDPPRLPQSDLYLLEGDASVGGLLQHSICLRLIVASTIAIASSKRSSETLQRYRKGPLPPWHCRGLHLKGPAKNFNRRQSILNFAKATTSFPHATICKRRLDMIGAPDCFLGSRRLFRTLQGQPREFHAQQMTVPPLHKCRRKGPFFLASGYSHYTLCRFGQRIHSPHCTAHPKPNFVDNR